MFVGVSKQGFLKGGSAGRREVRFSGAALKGHWIWEGRGVEGHWVRNVDAHEIVMLRLHVM